MPFQFLCPKGHLLQADPSQMGWTIQCPTCGVSFVIPTVPVAPAVSPVAPAVAVPPGPSPPLPLVTPGDQRQSQESAEQGGFAPELLDLPRKGRRRRSRVPDFDEIVRAEQSHAPAADQELPDLTTASPGQLFSIEQAQPRLVHVACPSGHELVTPIDTMGQQVLCPHCGEQFELRYTETLEYRQEQQRKETARESKLAKTWFIWAIVAGVAVLIMLVVMIVASSRH